MVTQDEDEDFLMEITKEELLAVKILGRTKVLVQMDGQLNPSLPFIYLLGDYILMMVL